MKKNFLTLLIIAFSIFGLFLSAEAETITKPNTFEDGTPALASEVNANFDTVYDQVNKVGTEVHIDSANHRVGIGTTSPGAKLTTAGEGSIIANTIAAYGDSDTWPAFVGLRARGTSSSPTAVQGGDLLGFFGAKGYYGTAFPDLATAGISIVATETYDDANQGTKMVFLTTSNGSTTKQDRMTISAGGNVGIGTKHPGSKLTIVGEGEKIGNAIVAYGGSAPNDVLPFFSGLRARGSVSSPTAVQSGDIFAYFGGKGYDGSQWPELSTAGISLSAAEPYTESSQGSRIIFYTTPVGTNAKQASVVIFPDGTLKQAKGYTQLALTTGPPDSGDCVGPGDFGRMKVDPDPSAEYLYICVGTGWKVATLGSPAP